MYLGKRFSQNTVFRVVEKNFSETAEPIDLKCSHDLLRYILQVIIGGIRFSTLIEFLGINRRNSKIFNNNQSFRPLRVVNAILEVKKILRNVIQKFKIKIKKMLILI